VPGLCPGWLATNTLRSVYDRYRAGSLSDEIAEPERFSLRIGPGTDYVDVLRVDEKLTEGRDGGPLSRIDGSP
jgi:hypothetical protein